MHREIRARDIKTNLNIAAANDIVEHDPQSDDQFEKSRSCVVAAVAFSAVGWLVVILIVWGLVQLAR
jgi:hypothetical protein